MVQGTVNGEGIGNLLCGLAGTVANTVYPSSIGSVSLTGNAARRVGVWAGIILIGLALLPKLLALLLAIPNPVAAGYMTTIFGLIFIQGVRIIAQDGLDARKAIVAGVAFWIGLGFQNQWVFPHLLDGAWGTLLGNGMTAGGFAAILMNAFIELTSRRRRRLDVEASMSALSKVDTFLHECATRSGWTEASTQHLCSVGEEALSSLLTQGDDQTDDDNQRMIIGARPGDGAIELEFIMTSEEENNLQDRLAYLDEQSEIQDEREISFRLLRHYASSVQHRKYHNIDIVTVRVEA